MQLGFLRLKPRDNLLDPTAHQWVFVLKLFRNLLKTNPISSNLFYFIKSVSLCIYLSTPSNKVQCLRNFTWLNVSSEVLWHSVLCFLFFCDLKDTCEDVCCNIRNVKLQVKYVFYCVYRCSLYTFSIQRRKTDQFKVPFISILILSKSIPIVLDTSHCTSDVIFNFNVKLVT